MTRVHSYLQHCAHACVPGVGPGGKIAFPWYDRSLITGDGSGDKSQLAEVLQAMQFDGHLSHAEDFCKMRERERQRASQ